MCSEVEVHRRTTNEVVLASPARLYWLGWFVRWEISDRTTVFFLGAAARISSNWHAASLCRHNLSFSPISSLKSKWYSQTFWKSSRFILLVSLNFYMVDSLFIAVHAFHICVLVLFLIDNVWLSSYVKRSIDFCDLINLEITQFWHTLYGQKYS